MWSYFTRKTLLKRIWRVGGSSMLLSAVGCHGYMHLSSSPMPRISLCHDGKSGAGERNLSKDEFSKMINERASRIREKYKRIGPVSDFMLMIWSVAGRPNTQSIELKFPKDGGDIVGLLAVWIEILSRQGAVELHSQADDGQGGKVVSFVSSSSKNDGMNDVTGCVSMTVRSLPEPSVTLFKEGGFSITEIKIILDGYERVLANSKPSSMSRLFGINEPKQNFNNIEKRSVQSNPPLEPAEELNRLGIEVYQASAEECMSWDDLAGYSDVKKEIKENILIPLKHPEVYDNLVKHTRQHVERNRPKAILLEGPPGTGKTLTAKIIASESNKAMVHLPVESIVSKWYGDSEKKLSQIFDACDRLGGVIIFIDEIDSLVGSRDNQSMHEATRRILSVILQRVEGFNGRGNNILIGATNRKEDLDAALVSRFDTSVRYELPDYETRQAILKRYAKHLGRIALHDISLESNGFSSRDMKDICAQAERRWIADAISNNRMEDLEKGLPESRYYLESLRNKKRTLEVKQKR